MVAIRHRVARRLVLTGLLGTAVGLSHPRAAAAELDRTAATHRETARAVAQRWPIRRPEEGSLATHARCGDWRWGSPHALPGTNGQVARFSSVVATPAGAYVLGNNIESLDPSEAIRDPFVLFDLDSGVLAGPRGGSVYAVPRGVADQHGRLHLLWAEPDTRPAPLTFPSWLRMHYSGVWHSVREKNGTWAKPELVFRGSVLWRKVLSDDVAYAANGRAHLVTPSMNPMESLVHMRFDGEGWAARPVSLGIGSTAYPSIAEVGENLMLAFVASAGRSSSTDVNSVFVTVSTDGGSRWSAPQLVNRSGGDPARDLKLRVDSRGRAHLFWVQDGGGGGVFRHTYSDDGGASWTAIEDRGDLGRNVNEPQVAIDSCERLQVIYTSTPDTELRPTLQFVTWDGAWSKPTPLHPRLEATDPSLARLAGGNLLLVFLGRPSDQKPGRRLLSMFTVFGPR